jgi:hypothetical protein
MKKIISYALLGITFCISASCSAASVSVNSVKIASKGETLVSATFRKTQVVAKITNHEVDIGKPSDAWPEKRMSSCTYSRRPCSPIDYLEILIDGNPLFVARSVYADLADVNTASLGQEKGKFVLILNGGDASESYTVEISFDGQQVKQRIFRANESGQVMQKTIYFVPDSMNN